MFMFDTLMVWALIVSANMRGKIRKKRLLGRYIKQQNLTYNAICKLGFI